MNDDDISELILRASAYLDGELDADELARAEADPAVMAEVEALRALQDQVRAVEAPAEAARESAIGAALAEFDRQVAGRPLTAVAAPAAVPLRPRPSYARWLTAAAAVVAIGVLGVVVAQSDGDDDDAAGSAEEFTVTAALDAASESLAEQDARTVEAPATMAAADAGDDVGGAPATAEDSAEPPADSPDTTREAADPTETGGAAGETTTEPATTAAPAIVSGTTEPSVIPTTAPRTFDQPITSENLFEIGQLLLADYRAGTLTVPATHCEFGGYVVLARAPFLVSDTEREAVIAADPTNGETGAFDADSCEPFEIVTPPAP